MTNYTSKEENTLKKIQNSIVKLNNTENRIYELDDLDNLTDQQAAEINMMILKKEKEALEEIRNILNEADIYEKYSDKDVKQMDEYYTEIDNPDSVIM